MDTEDMIQGLQQASWQKVDLSFHSAIWPFFAHNPVGVSLSSRLSFSMQASPQMLGSSST
jgi:hypothetical protein